MDILIKASNGASDNSFATDLYENLYASWTKIELPTKKNNIRSGEVQEVLWINYPLEETRSGQSNLFSAQLAI